MALDGGSRLVFQDGGSLSTHYGTIERVVKETLAVVRGLIPLDGVTIVIDTNSQRIIPEIGMGGFAERDRILIGINPVFPSLLEQLDQELLPLLAHEMHHVARIRSVGYGPHLLGAMVTEGLADHFSIEVAGIDPPLWSRALTGDRLAEWSARAEAQWYDTSYSHEAWFLGASPSIPRWTGYAVGFDLVETFLSRNPGRRPSGLVSEPAQSFVP